jgi:hypothetical protein
MFNDFKDYLIIIFSFTSFYYLNKVFISQRSILEIALRKILIDKEK